MKTKELLEVGNIYQNCSKDEALADLKAAFEEFKSVSKRCFKNLYRSISKMICVTIRKASCLSRLFKAKEEPTAVKLKRNLSNTLISKNKFCLDRLDNEIGMESVKCEALEILIKKS